MNDLEITDEELLQAKEFIEDESEFIGTPKLRIDCQEYKEKYENWIQTGLEIAEVLELVGFPVLAVKAFKAAKKGMDRHCKVSPQKS